MAMPSSGCGGPCCAQAVAGISPVWWRNRSTVWQAWCHSRWSVHERGWPSAFLFSRRKNNVEATRCCSVSSPAAIRRWTHWWLGLNRRVWHTMAVTPVRCWAATTASASARLSAIGISIRTCLPASIDLDGLGGVERCGAGEDGGVDPGLVEHLPQVERHGAGCRTRPRRLAVPVGVAPGDADDLDVVDAAQRGHVLAGDRTLAGHDDPHALSHAPPLRWRVVHNTVDDLLRHPGCPGSRGPADPPACAAQLRD